jgi:hypothetical protein
MFSISRFMFGYDESLNEGGNTRALVRDPETGLVKGPESIKRFRGREATAEKIDLRSGRIDRRQLREDVIEMLRVLDSEFERDHGDPIWDPSQRDDILGSGFAFNGSSAHLFAPPATLSDEEFIKYKPTVGDIDLTLPAEKMDMLFSTLNRREDQRLTDRISYIGHNKKSPGSHQINALFSYTWDPAAPEGEGDTFFQIDFEGSEYREGRPTEWAKFSYSSSWQDISQGVKGLAHKILLMSLASVMSPPPLNARESTPAATAEKPRVKQTRDPATGQMVPAQVRPLRSFDLVSGLGSRYKKLDWQFNGDEVYKYLKRVERTDSTRDLKEIFMNIFGEKSSPAEEDIHNLGSFTGLLKIMKQRMSPPEIVKIYEEMVDRFFGARGQQLSATDPKEDASVKDRILDVFREALTDAESSTVDLKALKQDFYSRYKVRGQEGFVEDTDQVQVDESRRRKLNRILESIIWER